MRTLLPALLGLILGLSAIAHADEKMLLVEFYLIAPQSTTASTDKMTRKLWRLGTKYLRFEDVPNPEARTHALIVVAEPDLWLVDRTTKTGKHALDPGPTYRVRFPILSKETSPRLKELEFGSELAFFAANKARELPPQTIEGVQFRALALTMDERELTLYVRADGRPFQLTVKAGDAEYSIRITRYLPDLPPDLKVFEPPKDVAFIKE